MINFRYHIVSLMAVFMALSVGIVLGVTLRGPVDEGLVTQAAQDRKQVQELRAELDRVKALDDYRDAWAARAGMELTQNVLTGRSVAIVAMPDAPTGVVNALRTAVTDSGGTLTHTARVDDAVFDPTQSAPVTKALDEFTSQLSLTDSMTNGTKFGLVLGRALLGRQLVERDDLAVEITESLTEAGLITVDGNSPDTAELAIVVTAATATPQLSAETLTDHVQFDLALESAAGGIVVAGPNSDGLDATDVLTVRNDVAAVDRLSTVDVADLTSGVTTTILAGKEQLVGRHGHYGALTKADAPLPELPVR